MPNFHKTTLTLIFASALFFSAANFALAQETGLTRPALQVNIPTVSFGSEKGLWIGEYISGIYKYAIGIVGILAAIVLMWGGLMWLTAGGNTGQVSEAKEWIKASLTGLLIALSSYLILYTVNPDLLKFSSLDVTTIKKINPEATSSLKASAGRGLKYAGSNISTADNLKNENDGQLYTQNNEGLKLTPYADAGFYSVGYGHFLSQAEYDQIIATGGSITKAQAENLFTQDYNQAVADAQSVAREYNINFSSLPGPKQNVLIDMAYNLGRGDSSQGTGLAGFKNTLTAIQNGQWNTAGYEILNSQYAGQVGARAQNNAAIMKQP